MKDYETPEIELLKLLADTAIAAEELSGGGFGEDIDDNEFDLDNF